MQMTVCAALACLLVVATSVNARHYRPARNGPFDVVPESSEQKPRYAAIPNGDLEHASSDHYGK